MGKYTHTPDRKNGHLIHLRMAWKWWYRYISYICCKFFSNQYNYRVNYFFWFFEFNKIPVEKLKTQNAWTKKKKNPPHAFSSHLLSVEYTLEAGKNGSNMMTFQ